MITIHQRNQKVSNDDDTVSKYAQNTLPWVLPDKYISDWHTVQLILSLPTLFSLFLPSTNSPLFEKGNVLFSLMTNNPPMNRLPISNSTYVQIATVKYFPSSLPNLARLRTRKVPCFANKVLEWYKHVFQFFWNLCIHLMTRSELQKYPQISTIWPFCYIDLLITSTDPCAFCLYFSNSLFTIHIQNCSIFVRFSSEAELQIFFWGSSLGKIQLGTNVTRQNDILICRLCL